MTMLHDIRAKTDLILALVILPALGIALAGKNLLNYIEFPPKKQYVIHAPFSWPIFIALALVILAFTIPFIIHVLKNQSRTPPVTQNISRSFPWWAWLGLALMLTTWLMAWTRFPWFTTLQSFTFTPIWLGYILVVNGLSHKRTGHCMLRHRPGYFLSLFLISALFWWYFEYLNRFVQNWFYVRVTALSPLQYLIFATLPFSTVLPAVLGTNELLSSFPRISAGLQNFIAIRIPHPRLLALISLIITSASLTFIGIWPNYLFPLLWVSPLFIMTSLQTMRGQKTIFSTIAIGNWQNIYLLALSGLICGLFWELWNYHSSAKWIYTVPFVNSFKIFEMPILGFAGYLPFGLECAVITQVIMKKSTTQPATNAAP